MLDQSIITELGLDQLPKNKQEEALNHIRQIIYQSVFIRIIKDLSPEDKDEFEALLAKPGTTSEEISAYLETKVSNLDRIIKEEIDQFRKDSHSFFGGPGKDHFIP